MIHVRVQTTHTVSHGLCTNNIVSDREAHFFRGRNVQISSHIAPYQHTVRTHTVTVIETYITEGPPIKPSSAMHSPQIKVQKY